MKDHRGTRDVAGKPFQLFNTIITGEDITPLPRGDTSKTQEGESLEINGSPSSPANDTTTDPDLLFSPLNAGLDDGDEEDEYDHDFLSPVYFGAAYPRRFHRRGSLTHAQPERRSSIVSPSSTLSDFLVNAGDDDFWREVGTTNEEAICFPESESTNTGPVVEPSSQDTTRSGGDQAGPEETPEDLSQFISEELGSAQPVDSSSWDQDCKIKLLCYRDAEGNLRLRNANSSGSARVHKKSRKFLKRAIRRKSGVREMVSTGIGIGEFML